MKTNKFNALINLSTLAKVLEADAELMLTATREELYRLVNLKHQVNLAQAFEAYKPVIEIDEDEIPVLKFSLLEAHEEGVYENRLTVKQGCTGFYTNCRKQFIAHSTTGGGYEI